MLFSSRRQGNFWGLETLRPRPRTSKCVLEDSTSGKGVIFTMTLIAWSWFNLYSCHIFGPWIRRFTMIMSAWWLRTSSEFGGQEFEVAKISKQLKSFIILAELEPKCVTNLRGPSPCHFAQASQLHSKKCCSGGEPLETLSLIWSVWDLNLRRSAPEMNALSLDQPAGFLQARSSNCNEIANHQLVSVYTVLWQEDTYATTATFFLLK